ncbi:MAG: efflux RND transporter periplasmic adaptor subunit, partial [Anaerolineae bacterium]|nr:efflux RND transporter periplasmic adaptor subunit [Anaerolineae bacterium]
QLDDSAAQLQLAQAEQALLEARTRLEVAQKDARLNLGGAQANYVEAARTLDDPTTNDQLTQTRVNFETTQAALGTAQEAYAYAFDPIRDWERNIDAERASAAAALDRAQAAFAISQAQYNLALNSAQNTFIAAEGSVYEAQQELIAAPGSALQADQWAVYKAELAVESARLALEATRITAPIAGTVTAIYASPGEAVGNNPVITLADLNQPVIRFYLEESDLRLIAPQNPVAVLLTAWPDQTFSGTVTHIDPAIVMLDGVPAVQVWAAMDRSEDSDVTLLAGMSAEVEVIAGEATNTLLIPVQALREIGPGQYAVFVVDANGELVMRPVKVGLVDFANAEILEGLSRGDTVSTGTVEVE